MAPDPRKDRATALARLAERPPETLIAFILSLADNDGPVAEHARTFIAADNLGNAVHSLHTRILALRRPPHRDHARRHAEAIGQRLNYILDAIETLILPIDPIAAFSLLLMVIESDGPAMEHCGDHHDEVTTAVHRTIAMVIQALPDPLPPEALATLKTLAAQDDYGTRRPLAAWLE